MDYEYTKAQRDYEALMDYMAELNSVPVTVCLPQPTPRWARQRTAEVRGTRIGAGCYIRGAVRA